MKAPEIDKAIRHLFAMERITLK